MMLKRRATPARRPAASRPPKPGGGKPSGVPPGKPAGDTFRDFIRTLERLDRGASHKQRAPQLIGEGAR